MPENALFVHGKSGSKTKKHFRACTQGSLQPQLLITHLSLLCASLFRTFPLMPVAFSIKCEFVISNTLRRLNRPVIGCVMSTCIIGEVAVSNISRCGGLIRTDSEYPITLSFTTK